MAISSQLGSSALLPAGLGFRNVLINGDMRIAQRGTTSTTSSSSGFACDRWNNFRSSGTSGITVTRQTSGLSGFQYCSRIQRDSGNTSTAAFYFVQNVESINSIPLAGKQVTLSFWARAGANYSASGGVLRSSIESLSYESNYWTTGDGAATTIFSQANNVLTTSWKYFSITGIMDSSHQQIFAAFKFVPVGTAGAADYFEITGVQVEQNLQPTPFEQRPISAELALCQRYFQKSYTQSVAPGTASQNGAVTVLYSVAYGATFGFQFRTTMRSAPSITLYSQSTGVISRVDSIGVGDTTYTLGEVGDSGVRYLQMGSGTSGCVFHYIASSEL